MVKNKKIAEGNPGAEGDGMFSGSGRHDSVLCVERRKVAGFTFPCGVVFVSNSIVFQLECVSVDMSTS
jgi:hypothetical protein